MQEHPDSTALERHYRTTEVAELWNVSADTVRRLFKDELGVIVVGKKKQYRRAHNTLLIPETVLRRVYSSLRKVEDQSCRIIR